MLTSEQKTILRERSLYTTFLAGALSSLAAPTFCELLLGSMISGEGFLTQFQQLKHEFGCSHLWQRKFRTVLRWMHIKMAGYAMVQLLTIYQNSAALVFAKTAWRHPDTVTAGMLRRALFWIIPRFRIRDCLNFSTERSYF